MLLHRPTYTRRVLSRRLFSATAITRNSEPQRFNIAIVGTGPAGFYTAHHLLNKSSPSARLNIDFFERLPAPYGLSRYGVAPDHPEVKNCEEYLDNIMTKYSKTNNPDSHTVRFFGNVNIGKDITLETLQKSYHSIVLSYGCTTADNQLAVPGSELPGVISAREFVNWYNGHPDFYEKGDSKFVPPDLSQIEDVTVVGNGNVALDVVRILLGDPDKHWSSTDISEEALEALKASKVKNVNIVARRGVLESAFSNKEIRELFELSKDGKSSTKFIPVDQQLLDSVDKKGLGRVDKRKVGLIEKYSQANAEAPENAKTWSLQYLKSPVEFIQNEQNSNLLSASKLRKNELVHDELENRTKVKGTEEFETIKNELVILSIGYKGSPLSGFEDVKISFDKNRLLNKEGRILSTSDEKDSNAVFKRGWYTSGWIKNGPQGVIATTMMDSFDTADKILEDLSNAIHLEPSQSLDPETIPHSISWGNWEKLNEYELEEGEKKGKSRYKVCNRTEMLQIEQDQTL